MSKSSVNEKPVANSEDAHDHSKTVAISVGGGSTKKKIDTEIRGLMTLKRARKPRLAITLKVSQS